MECVCCAHNVEKRVCLIRVVVYSCAFAEYPRHNNMETVGRRRRKMKGIEVYNKPEGTQAIVRLLGMKMLLFLRKQTICRDDIKVSGQLLRKNGDFLTHESHLWHSHSRFHILFWGF